MCVGLWQITADRDADGQRISLQQSPGSFSNVVTHTCIARLISKTRANHCHRWVCGLGHLKPVLQPRPVLQLLIGALRRRRINR
jgi:hypothetical protein